MRAVQITDFGGPEVLRLTEVEIPDVGPGQMRINVRAAGVNPVDGSSRDRVWAQWAAGAASAAQALPRTPGLEVAGHVDVVGKDTRTDLQVGDEVMAAAYGGGYADYVVVDAKTVSPIPRSQDLVHAATVPMGGLTALVAVESLTVDPGSWIMVTGAAGVVGGYVAQIAKQQGLRVIADAADKDRDFVTSLGVDHVVARGDAVVDRIRALQPGGVAAVIDTALLGPAILGALSDGGRLATLRQPGEPGTTPIPDVRGISVRGVKAPDYYSRPDKLEYLRHLVDAGALTVRVARTFALDDAPAAHRMLDGPGVRGRIVLTT